LEEGYEGYEAAAAGIAAVVLILPRRRRLIARWGIRLLVWGLACSMQLPA